MESELSCIFRVKLVTKNIVRGSPGTQFIHMKVKTNIFRIQAYDSIMCGYFCIEFIDFMFKGKSVTDYTNLFSPNVFKKNNDTILKYFMNNT